MWQSLVFLADQYKVFKWLLTGGFSSFEYTRILGNEKWAMVNLLCGQEFTVSSDYSCRTSPTISPLAGTPGAPRGSRHSQKHLP